MNETEGDGGALLRHVDRWIRLAGSLPTWLATTRLARDNAACRALYRSLYFTAKPFLERETVGRYRAMIRPGMTVLDVGANIGFYTTRFARWAGPSGQVHAFEPDTFCNRNLREATARLRGTAPVHVHPWAAWHERAVLSFSASRRNRADNRVLADSRAGCERVEVEGCPIDEVLAGLPSVDFVKLDVQGAEVRAIEGMRRLILRSPRAILVTEASPRFLAQAGDSVGRLLGLLRELGFRIRLSNGREVGASSDIAGAQREGPVPDWRDGMDTDVDLWCDRDASP